MASGILGDAQCVAVTSAGVPRITKAPPNPEPQAAPVPARQPVPWRTIGATIGMVLATLAGILLLRELTRIVIWLVVAAFFAVILSPPVDFLVRRARVRRGLATLVVFVTGALLLSGMMYTFIRPLVDQGQNFAEEFPRYVEDAKAGRGTVGELVQRYDLDQWIEENQDRLSDFASDLGTIALKNVGRAASFVFGAVTILVLTFLMLLQGPSILAAGLNVVPERHRDRVQRVAHDAARAVTGYMFGNLVISVIAGSAAYVFLLIAGVPFKEVLALWVAFADLIPMVGATLGAVPAVAVAFLHSVPVGIATVIFFIVYQQFENHVLQVSVMSRTVDINPLLVLVSVLIGVELMGFGGALLAIPAAGMIQVIVRDLWDETRGAPKETPTVGAAEVPLNAG
jgi:predicted PurR-regulated permease PerM